MARRRLFYAIWPEPAERAALAAAAHSLFPLSGRPVPEADFHITLAFVGAVDDARLAAFQALAQPVTPFDVTLDVLEHWPKPRVLVAAARQAPPRLADTVEMLWRQLDRLGVAREPRPFRAHATLARDVRQWRSGRPFPAVTWTATRIRLVESCSDASPRYVPLDPAARTA